MDRIDGRDLRSYGMLAFPLAVAGLPLYLHAPDFYLTERGVSLSAIGLILLFVRVFDAVQDPLIGAISDRYQRHRRGIMMSALTGLSLGMICLFIPPAGYASVWFAFWVVVATTCFSVLSINLNTLGGIWSHDSYEKTVIASSRERFGLFGVLTGVLVPGILAVWYSKGIAFAVFALVLFLVILYCGTRFWNWSISNRHLFDACTDVSGQGIKLRLPDSPASKRLILLTLPSAFASALPAVLFLFFVRDAVQAESLVWVFLMVYFISAMVGIPVWRSLSKRYGKATAWCLSISMAIVSFVAAAFVSPGAIPLYVAVCLFTGFALGGDLVFPASLMADFVDKDPESRGHAGTGYAWLSFVQKAGLGLAAGIAFPILETVGFSTGTGNTATALLWLTILYAVVPLIMKSISLWMLWAWRGSLEEGQIYEKKMDNNLCRTANAGPDTNWM